MQNQLQQKSLGRLISYLYRQAQRYFEREFSEYGLGQGTFAYLHLLLHRDGINQQELSERLRVDKATTTRALKKLVELGFVRRERDSHDHRAYRIFLTQKARDLEPEFMRARRVWTDLLADGFTQEERDSALKLLERMVDNVVRHKHALHHSSCKGACKRE